MELYTVPFHLKIILHPPPQKNETKLHEQNLSQSNDAIDYCVLVVVGITCVLPPKYPLVHVPWKSINVCGYSDQLCIFWTLGGQCPQMTLDDLWVGSHVCPYPNILKFIKVCGYSTIYANLDHLGSMTSNDPKLTFDPIVFFLGGDGRCAPTQISFLPKCKKVYGNSGEFWSGLTFFT